jgi:hypothetical protein
VEVSGSSALLTFPKGTCAVLCFGLASEPRTTSPHHPRGPTFQQREAKTGGKKWREPGPDAFFHKKFYHKLFLPGAVINPPLWRGAPPPPGGARPFGRAVT